MKSVECGLMKSVQVSREEKLCVENNAKVFEKGVTEIEFSRIKLASI
jgi:hypothetical protein